MALIIVILLCGAFTAFGYAPVAYCAKRNRIALPTDLTMAPMVLSHSGRGMTALTLDGDKRESKKTIRGMFTKMLRFVDNGKSQFIKAMISLMIFLKDNTLLLLASMVITIKSSLAWLILTVYKVAVKAHIIGESDNKFIDKMKSKINTTIDSDSSSRSSMQPSLISEGKFSTDRKYETIPTDIDSTHTDEDTSTTTVTTPPPPPVPTAEEVYQAKMESDRLKVKARMKEIDRLEKEKQAKISFPTSVQMSDVSTTTAAVDDATLTGEVMEPILREDGKIRGEYYGDTSEAVVGSGKDLFTPSSSSDDTVNLSHEGDDDIREVQLTLAQKIKKGGASATIAYLGTELAFWTLSIPVIITSYHSSTGEWLNIANAEERNQILLLSTGVLSIARLAVPLRLGLALYLTPYVDKFLNRKKE